MDNFDERNREFIARMGKDPELREKSRDWFAAASKHEYSYHFRWLGLPIIQFPQDVIAIQELIWSVKPDLIIETGIARGGSLVLSASILELLKNDGRVIGIDVDIRAPNRAAIEAHPLAQRITMIEGSSTDEVVLRQVGEIASRHKKCLVILDSNHTHDHVRKELDLYSPFVKAGSYLVVMDTVIEDMPADFFPERPWSRGNNPKTAVHDFLKKNARFEVDQGIQNKLLISVAPKVTLNASRIELKATLSMERIPVFIPYIGVDTLKHLTDALDVGWLGMGATTKEFEERISDYLGLKGRYVVATNTGTSAFHVALRGCGIGPGDEVITTSFNYVADHQAIHMSGATPAMCDIRDDNLGIDCDKAEALITERTRAIDPLHFAGIPCDMDGVYRLANKYGLRVLEDATHAFGTTIGDRKIGSFGDVTWFSFDPVKIVTSIDGGCVVTPSAEEAERMQRLRLLGVDRDTTERYKNRRAWEYDVVSEGYRYHLTNIMASVGISQIKKVSTFIETRRRVCKIYNEQFKDLPGIKVPATTFDDVSPFIYSLRILNGRREAFVDHMKAREIDVGIHFIPVHEHAFFRNAPRGPMEVTDRVVTEVVTLPLHSMMKPEFVERVVDAVRTFKAGNE